ncbi:small membrane protein [Klebsiella aerogenes]|nr:small membrane protein [Klebsiella aerogenes]UNX71915.1 small membrane protein [Klebsiella aerogenes]HBY1517697.1 small membrane protein [Klebsiella aerogenes]HBY1604035.1 small membrane protein [Klebsiella aerogenes]HBY1640815.1 small membrane protein [Klebsiella aerogenes]
MGNLFFVIILVILLLLAIGVFISYIKDQKKQKDTFKNKY